MCEKLRVCVKERWRLRERDRDRDRERERKRGMTTKMTKHFVHAA